MAEPTLFEQCEAYLDGLGLPLERRGDISVFTIIDERAVGNDGDFMKHEISIWDGCVQVDMLIQNKKGKLISRKSIIWGWLLKSIDDLKLLFERQVNLSHYITQIQEKSPLGN